MGLVIKNLTQFMMFDCYPPSLSLLLLPCARASSPQPHPTNLQLSLYKACHSNYPTLLECREPFLSSFCTPGLRRITIMEQKLGKQ